MPALILHVEDDLVLRAIVSVTFQSLGFQGKTISATTVAQAQRVLDKAARDRRTIDLILSDMHLPDGTGLDLVKFVRAHRVWNSTPMLILSGDLDPKHVSRAYALGANAYVDKWPHGRNLSEVITTLYRHWMTDVVPARGGRAARSTDVLARAMTIRLRCADVYVRVAQQLVANPTESAFWLSRALAESNLSNLLAFLKQQLDGTELGELTTQIAGIQQATETALEALEHDLASAQLSRDEIYRRILELLASTDVNVVALSLGALFPVSPVATTALRDLLLGAIGDVTAWIELHTDSPELHERAAELRGDATALSSMPGAGEATDRPAR